VVRAGRRHVSRALLAVAASALLAACGASVSSSATVGPTTATTATTVGATAAASASAGSSVTSAPTSTPSTSATLAARPSTTPSTAPATTKATAPPTTKATTPTTAGATITKFSAGSSTVSCPDSATQQVTLTWATSGATSVTVSIDGPGIYDTYAATGSVQVPFACGDAKHTYLLTALGGPSPVQKTIVVTRA